MATSVRKKHTAKTLKAHADKKAAYLKAKKKKKMKKDSPEMPQSQSQWNIAAGARRKKNDALAAHSSFGIRTQEPQSHPVTKKKKKKKY